MDSIVRDRAPAHLWAVGILSLLWNAYGCYDYLMTKTHNADYVASMGMNPETVFAYADSMPIWSQIGWGLGVWGALLGAILLLMRNRYAVHAYAASLLGIILSIGWEIVAGTVPDELHQGPATFMPYVIIAIGLLQLWYAWTQRSRNVLR